MRIGDRSRGPARLHIGAARALPRRLRPFTRELTRMRVLPDARGAGAGSALLKDVCDEADKEGVLLYLTVDECECKGKLVEWYSRHGFDVLQTAPIVMMARKPGEKR